MIDIKEQIEWERECGRRGAETYYATQDTLKEKGRQDQSDGYNYIMKDRLIEIAELLKSKVEDDTAGYKSTANGILRNISQHVSYNMMVFFCTQVVLRAVSNGKNKKSMNVTKVLATIGERMETEIKCTLFEAMNPEYYDTIVKSFKQQKIQDYDHKRRVVMTMFKDYATGWTDWGPKGRIGVGAKVMECFLEVMSDLFFIEKVWESRKVTTKLVTTVAFDDWIAAFEQTKGLMQPALLPLKIRPLDWNAEGIGGYYTPRMQMVTPFIKTKGKEHQAFVDRFVPEQHIAAVNRLQATAWDVNREVLQVMKTVYNYDLGFGLPSPVVIKPPPIPKFLEDVAKEDFDEEMTEELTFWKAQAKQSYYEEAKRKGKVLTFMQTIRLAEELAEWQEFYFVHTCDFRGRIYCATSSLSPQGDEKARALMQFKQGVRLGETGVKWLAIHGANMWGEKNTHAHRFNWTVQRANQIAAIVADPYRNTEWSKASKPYQFLAFCYEWAKVKYGTDVNAISHLPVGIDGSCNGLQHFSAILRDQIGAEATNLQVGVHPSDIYQRVADRCMSKLKMFKGDDEGLAGLVFGVGIDRNGTKRQTMTLPYGATKQACREYTFAWLVKNWDLFGIDKTHRWTTAAFLSPIIWDSIGETVVAAMVAMEWLQRNVGKQYSKWVSFVGFPCYQYYKEMKPIRINTKLGGSTRLSARDIDGEGGPNRYKQRLGIVPNFIHSVDASHLVLTVNAIDLPAWGMVHDEYATHAGRMEELHVMTMKSFHHLHKSVNQLELWAKHQGIAPEHVPKQGTFDIDKVLTAVDLFG